MSEERKEIVDRRPVIAYDIDGTLCVEPRFEKGFNNTPDEEIVEIYSRCFPIPSVIDMVWGHYEADWKVLMWTARDERFRDVTEECLGANAIPYHGLIMNKPYMHAYIGNECLNVRRMASNKQAQQNLLNFYGRRRKR